MPNPYRLYDSIYNKGYYAGYRKATIDHLGGKCVECSTTFNLELHHIDPIRRTPRSVSDLADITKLMVLCKKCHSKRG